MQISVRLLRLTDSDIPQLADRIERDLFIKSEIIDVEFPSRSILRRVHWPTLLQPVGALIVTLRSVISTLVGAPPSARETTHDGFELCKLRQVIVQSAVFMTGKYSIAWAVLQMQNAENPHSIIRVIRLARRRSLTGASPNKLSLQSLSIRHVENLERKEVHRSLPALNRASSIGLTR
jgi:hypothetical protein